MRRLSAHLIVHELAAMALGEARLLDTSRSAQVRRIAREGLPHATFDIREQFDRSTLRMYTRVLRRT